MKAQDLKNSILQLAVQGKLVEQRPEDGTAEELYQKIQAEKQKLIKEGKIKKEKPLPPITEDEIPFDIPETWKWVRWGDLSQKIQYGYNAPALQTGKVRMIRISDIQDASVLWDKVPFCDISEEDTATYSLCENDILFARTGGTVGKSYLVKDVPYKAVYAGYLIRTQYSSLLIPEYLKFFMETDLYWRQLRSGTIATAQPNCNGQTLSKMIIPLPPLDEQKRIVAKIEEFEPLINQYDQAEQELSVLNDKFPEQLKKSILQQAIQGKLVEQRPEDGTAEELYQKIQAEKQKLIKEGKIKKEKPLPPISEDEIPFDIPETWKWVRLEDIVSSIPTKKHQILQSQIDKKGKYPVVSQSSSLIEGYCNNEDKIFFHKYPVLIFGDHTKCIKFIDFDFVVGADGVKLLEPYFDYGKYLYYTLTYFIINMTDRGYSRHYQFIKNQEIPLPPLGEQKRIVAKIEEVFAGIRL